MRDLAENAGIALSTVNLIEKGKLKFDKSENDHMTVTFHDSCNVARASRMGDKPGGQFDIPRAVIKAACNNFVDMAQEISKTENEEVLDAFIDEQMQALIYQFNKVPGLSDDLMRLLDDKDLEDVEVATFA